MITRTVRIQIVVFILIAVSAVSFIGIRYVGLLRYFGASGYTVSVNLPDTGGLFTNAEVTYRGVPVGRVGSMQLTDTGIAVKLNLDSGTKIPADLTANVADRSAIGEQYLNLVPNSNDGPYLHEHSIIQQADTTTPVSANQLLESQLTLLNSIPIGSLQTTVTELSNAFQDTAPDLQRLLDSAQGFYQVAAENFPQTSALIDSSKGVLQTQEDTSASIVSFSHSLSLLAAQLKSSDGDLQSLIDVTPGAATSVNTLFSEVGAPFGVLIANLLSGSQITNANINGLQTLLVKAPEAIYVGNKVITPTGANLGLALTFFDPLPCTAGYGGTVHRAPQLTSNTALNTVAGCGSTAGGSTRALGSSAVSAGNAATAGTDFTLGSQFAAPATVGSLADLLGGQG